MSQPRQGSTITVEHASRWYGDVVAVNDISFTVDGGVTGLLDGLFQLVPVPVDVAEDEVRGQIAKATNDRNRPDVAAVQDDFGTAALQNAHRVLGVLDVAMRIAYDTD